MNVTDLSGELTITAEATGSLEGSYTTSLSITGTEESVGPPTPATPADGLGLTGLGDSIRSRVSSNLAGALANLPSMPGL